VGNERQIKLHLTGAGSSQLVHQPKPLQVSLSHLENAVWRVHARNILRGILSLILYRSLLVAGFHTFNPTQYQSLEMLYETASGGRYYETPHVCRQFQ